MGQSQGNHCGIAFQVHHESGLAQVQPFRPLWNLDVCEFSGVWSFPGWNPSVHAIIGMKLDEQ
jgi:hypothetical protein